MNLKRSTLRPQNRRGLSSVVGALFFVILMIAGFSVLSLALDAQTDIVTTQRIVSDTEIKKQQEQFGVFASTDGNNLLSVSVDNQGQNPVEISSIWIVNKTLSDQPATRYAVTYDDAFIPTGLVINVLFHQALAMTPDTYDIKVISALGSIETIEFNAGAGASNGLRAELITDAPDVIIGQNVTVAMLVTNIGTVNIENVKPEPLSVSGTGSVMASTPHTPSSVNLNRGESVMFSWDYQVTGNSGDDLTFSTFAKGDYESPGDVSSNVVSDVSVLRVAGEGGGGEEVVIKDELFGKPKIFMIMPNAMGDDNGDNLDRAVWGVNVANPTDQPMFVSKVVIIAISPRATSSDKMFIEECEKASNSSQSYGVETISPTPDNWTCPETNQLMWRDVANPQLIEPRSVFPFLAKITGADIGGALSDSQNIVIQPIVYTTLGQFGKAGYGTTMHSKEIALPNVFLATAPNSVLSSDIIGVMRGITEGTTVTFNATLADMSSTATYGINSGTDLIINVPKEWIFGSIVSDVGFTTSPPVTYPDGSTQIVGKLIDSIDEHAEAKTITFTATAPSVTNAKMYVMHILASGTSSGDNHSNFTVGPIAETVLQVCPTSGCP